QYHGHRHGEEWPETISDASFPGGSERGPPSLSQLSLKRAVTILLKHGRQNSIFLKYSSVRPKVSRDSKKVRDQLLGLPVNIRIIHRHFRVKLGCIEDTI